METIFDYNPSDKEISRFGGLKAKNLLINFYKLSDDDRLYHLGLLFSSRGDKERAKKYWEQMKDKSPLKALVTDFP